MLFQKKIPTGLFMKLHNLIHPQRVITEHVPPKSSLIIKVKAVCSEIQGYTNRPI